MKNLIDLITESTAADKFIKDHKFIVVYPTGGIEMFTEDGLQDLLGQDFQDEDELAMYEELSELPNDSKWHMISGPEGNGDLKVTIGRHAK